MLTKEQLTDAYEQGLSINTRNGNIKIVTILGDVYGVNHCETNSKLVKWWMFENFERNQATIEQPNPKVYLSILNEGEIYYAKSDKYEYVFIFKIKNNTALVWDANYLLRDNEIHSYCGGIRIEYIKDLRLPTESELELFYSKFPELKPKPQYNGRAVKCDTVEQWQWLTQSLGKFINIQLFESNCCVCIQDKKNEYIGTIRDEQHFKHECYEIISFSQYCTENGINEPKWIQGFEVKDGYNDVVMVSDDNKNWEIEVLREVMDITNPFSCSRFSFKYCRYLNKEEINEIKFVY